MAPRSRERKPRERKPRARKPRAKRRRKITPATLGAAGRVLALDSSSKCVGWSVFDDGHPVKHGQYLQQGKEGAHGEKLARFLGWLQGLLATYQPDRLVYEAPYQGRMRHTFGILSRYVGVIEAVHFQHFGREIDKRDAVPAHLVKKALGVARGANHEDNKRLVVAHINEVYGLNLKFHASNKSRSQDDVADAIAVNRAWHLLYATP